MLRLKFVNNVQFGLRLPAAAFAPDDNVVRTDFFDARTYFHVRIMLLSAMTHCV